MLAAEGAQLILQYLSVIWVALVHVPRSLPLEQETTKF